MTLRISPHAIEQDQGPFIFPGVLVGSGPDLPATPDGTLHVHTSTAGAVTAIADADDVVIESSGNTGLTFFTGPTNDANIVVGKVGTAEVARLQYDHIGNAWRFFGPTAQEYLELSNSSAIFNDPGNDVDFRVGAVGEANALFVQGSDGKVGFGTATIPHGGVGWAKIAIDGANASAAGPHMQFTTASDDYPTMQIWSYTHDNLGIFFDAYFDGSSRSSDAGSSFFMYKQGDTLSFQMGIGAAGSVITWYPKLIIGGFSIKNEVPIKIKEIAAAFLDVAGYGQLWVKNTTPCELWFTDDAGTDTQIV